MSTIENESAVSHGLEQDQDQKFVYFFGDGAALEPN